MYVDAAPASNPAPLVTSSCRPTTDEIAAFQEYTKAIDIWSVGCILAEMSE